MDALFTNQFTYYGRQGFNLDHVIQLADKYANGFDGIDTLVCVGLSGMLVTPALAAAFDKHLAVVRKVAEANYSHNHMGHLAPLVGTVGCDWVFVDDFIGMGDTRSRAMQVVAQATKNEARYRGSFLYSCDPERSYQGLGPWRPDAIRVPSSHLSDGYQAMAKVIETKPLLPVEGLGKPMAEWLELTKTMGKYVQTYTLEAP